ncbi:hypothetical protein B9Z19DRAFT_1172826 [Tuber borchii]|uniref:Uncharacterized protein n=1 Tax=Tuber borchii TaxID=42251 RepID=A0A2T7A7U1_TUBBO|nr:hypothetical protein B9Z19DRAFT_1172826 [Tuber borchii]
MASAVSHQVAIARTSLAAGLLRPDPTAVSRDDISSFHALLEQALSNCSPSNIQITTHTFSPDRTALMMKERNKNEEILGDLNFIVKHGTSATPTARPTASVVKAKVLVEKPLLLPPFHGDPSLPFYDLPAANMLPHLIPNSPTPINPRLMKPIQFSTLVPNESLVAAVKDFIKSVDDMFNGDDALMEDPDAIGGGGGEGYYGCSRGFCEKMKQKKRAALKEKRDSRRRNDSYSLDGVSRLESRVKGRPSGLSHAATRNDYRTEAFELAIQTGETDEVQYLFENVTIETLYGASAMGAKICIYKLG